MSAPGDHRYPGIGKPSVCLLHAWLASVYLQSRLREIESEKQWNVCNGTQGLVREIENFERLEVREIWSKFALLYREKKRDRSFTSRDRELREIEVQAIESYLYAIVAKKKKHR